MISAFDLVSVVEALADETLESDERSELAAERNDLIERIDAALAVAGAVEWCKEHCCAVEWDEGGGCSAQPMGQAVAWASAPTLAAAVAALAQRAGKEE